MRKTRGGAKISGAKVSGTKISRVQGSVLPRRVAAGPTKAPRSGGKLTHSADGIDLTLIRWMLSLTPAERLQVLQRHVQSVMRLRGQRSPA